MASTFLANIQGGVDPIPFADGECLVYQITDPVIQ